MTCRRVALVLISDREDRYLPACVDSIDRHVDYPIHQTILVADPGHEYTASGAVNAAWSQVDDEVDWILHVEEDFVLTAHVDVDAMCDVLDSNPRLAHLVLKRQPWSPQEHEAGGIIEMRPESYIDHDQWIEHTNFFSLNPSIVPRRVFEQGFQEGSEPVQTWRLLDQGYVFGFWGRRDDPPRCWHMGAERAVGSRR